MPEDQQSDKFLVLSDETLSGLGLTVLDIVEAIEQAIIAEALGDILTSPKSALLPGDGRYMMTTLATGDDPNLTIVKSVMVSPRNPARGRPGVDGALMVQDSETGQLLAIMQAGWITGMRTAGLSGVAARRLANPGAQQIAFVGSGVQARSHLQTFAALFPLTGISVYGRGQANIDRLCVMADDMGLNSRVCDTPRAAVEEADLIVSSVTLTHGIDPFVDAHWLKPGAFAAITDLALPWKPDSMSAFGAIFIDNTEQERASPQKMVSPDLVTGDLRALLDGSAQVALGNAARRAFIFRGIAIGDYALARLVWDRAQTVAAGQSAGW
ncbi:MAG: ornithine cyclodeaminase [Paracoccaceae bacterium]|jgi:ornithine cyclodeaminase